jgi:hypothetical protein
LSLLPRKNIFWLGILALPFLAFGVWLYHKFNPLEYAFFPPCPFYVTTDLYCPGCGSQRAFHALLHGDILGALQHNLLIMLAFLVMLYKVYLLWSKKSNTSSNILYKNSTPWFILIVVIGFWILRNIPVEPFTYLAP